jgi:hypothetical protein
LVIGCAFWTLMVSPHSPLPHALDLKAASWWADAVAAVLTGIAGQVASASLLRCIRVCQRLTAWRARGRKRRMDIVERLNGPGQWQDTRARKQWAEGYRKVRDAILIGLLGSASTLLIGRDVIAGAIRWLFGGLTPEEWLGQIRHPAVWPEMLLMAWVLTWDEAVLLIGIRMGLPVPRRTSWNFFAMWASGVFLIDAGVLRPSGPVLQGWIAFLMTAGYALWALWAHVLDPRARDEPDHDSEQPGFEPGG